MIHDELQQSAWKQNSTDLLTRFRKSIKQYFPVHPRRTPQRATKLAFEPLEDRCLLAACSVALILLTGRKASTERHRNGG
jgi:hypothetical protein